MTKNTEYHLLGICKYCGQEVFGTHPNKLQAHQRFCKENPNRNKALNQIKSAGLIGSKISNANRLVKAKILNEKHSHKFICKKCNCEYELWLSDRDFERGNYSKYCSIKCSHSRQFSIETKQKISNSVKKEHKHICVKCNKEFFHKGTSGIILCDECFKEQYKRNRENKGIKNNTILHKTQCKECGKDIWCKTTLDIYCYECALTLNKNVRQLYTPDGKKCISNETRKKLSDRVQERIKNKTHVGWTSRNIKSYAEKFWINVLNTNNIKYVSEKRISEFGYFLDFCITLPNGKMIDLEIDGKQHTYADRIQHDKIRDKRIRTLGYLIYRVPWNNINTKIGKMKMKAKIKQFLWWFNKIKCMV